MSSNPNITLFAKGQQQSTDNYNDFGYFNDGTFWYEKTPTYTARLTAYAAATGITDYTILDPLNIFDLGLTYYGLDTIMKAIYPMVTDKTSQSDMANQMKYNFMNPLDTNPAFRLNWFGGWIYSRTGALPNGVNAYANTNLIPSGTLSLNSTHLSYYSRSVLESGVDMGCQIVGAALYLWCRDIGGYTYVRVNTYGSGTESSVINTNGTGLYISNRNSSTVQSSIKNNIISNFNVNSVNRPNVNIWLGGLNNPIPLYGSKQCAFASIGNGLTDFQAQIFSTLVNNLQIALNRAVY